MTRLSQAIILLLFGGAIVRASITDLYLRYVKEGLRPFLIAAGALLIAGAVMTLWWELTDHDAEGIGHDHAHHEPRVGWLLILPVIGLLLVAPPALGSYAAGQAGTVLTAQTSDSDYPALPPGDPAPISLLDYASRAVFDGGKTLTGRTLRLTGFITTGPDGQPLLTRIVLTCCAADGRPIKVGLIGDVPTAVPADAWVTVVGGYSPRIEKDPVNKATVPYLEVRSWQQIPAPTRQYE
jgi:uncharacterized repeat protein (TIGR03943 family)